MIQEIESLNASGTNLNYGTRYGKLKNKVNELESEKESLDFRSQSKSVVSVTIKHSDYACIGTESCFK
jgi:hypothetical protein